MYIRTMVDFRFHVTSILYLVCYFACTFVLPDCSSILFSTCMCVCVTVCVFIYVCYCLSLSEIKPISIQMRYICVKLRWFSVSHSCDPSVDRNTREDTQRSNENQQR